ncbi:MAG: Mu transposase domain-containing protein, partial [Propionibacteriaceae bacterium]
EKGAVENLCGYVRRNALVPMPEVGDLEELNKHLLKWCDEDLKKHPEWEAERAALRPLPKAGFKACRTRLAVVSKLALVTCDRNRYSVPSNLVGQTVRLDVYSDRIEVYHRSALVARHTRLTRPRWHGHGLQALSRRGGVQAPGLDGGGLCGRDAGRLEDSPGEAAHTGPRLSGVRRDSGLEPGMARRGRRDGPGQSERV